MKSMGKPVVIVFNACNFSFGEDIYAQNWADVRQVFVRSDQVHKILSVMDLIISIPTNSTAMEEDIRIKRLLETKRPNKIRSSSTLSDLMLVVRETPDIKAYDPTADVQTWVSDGMKTVREKMEDIQDDEESAGSNGSDVCIVEDSDDEDNKRAKQSRKSKSNGTSSTKSGE